MGALNARLPVVFTFGARCADHYLDALGESDAAGVWRTTRLLLVSQLLRVAGSEHKVLVGERESLEYSYENLELWRAGELSEAAMARRAELLAAANSELWGQVKTSPV